MRICRGLEQALDQYGQSGSAPKTANEQDAAASEADALAMHFCASSMREKRKTAWKQLTVPERDVLTVLAAVCKVSMLTCCLVNCPTATMSRATNQA